MKAKPVQATAHGGQPRTRMRTSRVAAVRRIEPQRPTRMWSLLLLPTFPVDRK